jgi:signal transduction histidine kinase/CheY-like chemotaxis protein
VVGELVECEQFGTGERRFFLNNAAPIRDASGRIIGGVVAELDVTSRRHAEEQLQLLYVREQAARASAEEASRLKDEFLATVSHELRTPLTAFLGHAQLLQTRKRDEAYVGRTIEKMVRSASAQARLIEDLLDVSRIVTGNLRIEREPVDLLAIVGAAIDTVRPTLEARELQLQAELDPAAGAVVGDANRLQQVAWNLLANAAKFTPQGGTIAVRLARRGDEAELQVRDNGRGISPAFLPHVFERFRQADSSSTRSYNGLGLGLAIVRHLVELHGGSVAADSAGEDQGATFTVRLPLAGAADARALDSRGPQREPQQDSSPTLSGLRVLLVDDEEGILELLHDIFAFCGADVRTCTSARAALALLQGWRPAVLISDIAMPGEDGYWLIRAVRALRPEDGGATPAVALTAYARPEDRHQILEAGFQLYVPKPVEPRALCELVADLVAPDAG